MNYFEYFTEIEDRFTARRGSVLLLSTLDWALIETWREAEIPLAAVLRGIDNAFDRYDARKARAKGRLTRVNGLAWCAQAVLEAASELAEAAVGVQAPQTTAPDTGFEATRIATYLEANARALDRACERSVRHPHPAITPVDATHDPDTSPIAWRLAAVNTAARLRQLAAEVRAGAHPALDELDRTLTVLEERMEAALLAHTPEADLLALRETADRELAHTRLAAAQRRHIRDSFVQKRLFAIHNLPRLSLFYMPVTDAAETTLDRPGTHAAV